MTITPEYTRPFVSVIIPTHNRSTFLKEMLDSLAAQTYRPIEVIVVDDGSTDDTPQMMPKVTQALRTAGLACRYTVQSKSNGSYARNRGFQLSSGQYVVFMDSDDYAHPEMIARMVEMLERTGADFCVCDSERFHFQPGDTSEVKRLSRRRHSARAHIHTIALQTCFLAKRSVITAIGPWDEKITHRDDVEYTFRLLVSRFRGVWIPEVLYYWRAHDHQMSSRTDEEAATSSLLVLTKMVAFAESHGQHTWPMRVAFGREFARLAYACNRLNYTDLAQRAGRLADRECPGIRLPFYLYGLTHRILGEKGVSIIKSLPRRVGR